MQKKICKTYTEGGCVNKSGGPWPVDYTGPAWGLFSISTDQIIEVILVIYFIIIILP